MRPPWQCQTPGPRRRKSGKDGFKQDQVLVIKHGIIGIVEQKCKFSDKSNPTTRIRNSLTARPLLVNHKKAKFPNGGFLA